MAPGSRRSSASSSSTGTSLRQSTLPVHTAAITPDPGRVAHIPLSASTPPTSTSNLGAPPSIRVRGPTIGKRVRKIIAHTGDKLPVYVTQELRAFCRKNATKVSNELGSHIRRVCPIDGFFPSWKHVDSALKEAITQAVRARKVAGKKNRESLPYNHTLGSRSFTAAMTIAAEGNDGKLPDFCHTYEISHKLKETNEWISPICKDLHDKMVVVRDEASQSGTQLTNEQLSKTVLGDNKYYIRGFGVRPNPSSYRSKSSFDLARQEEIQKLQSELELLREERQREREEDRSKREELQKQNEEQQKEIDEIKNFMKQFKNYGRDHVELG